MGYGLPSTLTMGDAFTFKNISERVLEQHRPAERLDPLIALLIVVMRDDLVWDT